jgi:ribosomal protection tetracycline resistance protein
LQFAPPALEAVITACHRGGRAALRAALGQLAEQDPLINVRQSGGELSVSLYGEVQKEVIAATLASDFGVEVTFRETMVIYIERVAGSGVAFRLDVDVRSVPMYVYKITDNFAAMMTRYVRQVLARGPRGWRVTDCLVTMVACDYVSPSTTAAHFRKLTPLVLLAALDQAGTHVCEPLTRLGLEIPDGTVSAVLSAAARLGGTAGRHGWAARAARGPRRAGDRAARCPGPEAAAAAARPDQRRRSGRAQLRRLPATAGPA